MKEPALRRMKRTSCLSLCEHRLAGKSSIFAHDHTTPTVIEPFILRSHRLRKLRPLYRARVTPSLSLFVSLSSPFHLFPFPSLSLKRRDSPLIYLSNITSLISSTLRNPSRRRDPRVTRYSFVICGRANVHFELSRVFSAHVRVYMYVRASSTHLLDHSAHIHNPRYFLSRAKCRTGLSQISIENVNRNGVLYSRNMAHR